jgi:hypothetical protein
VKAMHARGAIIGSHDEGDDAFGLGDLARWGIGDGDVVLVDCTLFGTALVTDVLGLLTPTTGALVLGVKSGAKGVVFVVELVNQVTRVAPKTEVAVGRVRRAPVPVPVRVSLLVKRRGAAGIAQVP